jgi:2,4-dienoyl-CoA reductase-like NADH-dependent reductase (Old Yellow Enzyme family)
MNSSPARLFDSLRIRGVELRNRVMISPMCQYSATNRDGMATDWHFAHLGGLARGGAGIVCAEATAVLPEGRISPEDLGLWDDAQIAPLARITRFMVEQGAASAIQLAHAGRKASTWRPWSGSGAVSMEEGGWQVVAPSVIPFAPNYPQPVALTTEGIAEVVAAFAASARRAVAAGFQIIEIHAAHGYLLHEFLSPVSNARTDAYGGDFAGRARLPLEVAQAVREAIPEEMPLFMRISVTDWLEDEPDRPSWTVDQSAQLAALLHDVGVDVLDCSSGGNVLGARVPTGPGYQTPFAERIRRETGMPTIALGEITDPVQAEHILRTGQADLVAIARAALRNPHWPLLAAAQLKQETAWPVQYERARP